MTVDYNQQISNVKIKNLSPQFEELVEVRELCSKIRVSFGFPFGFRSRFPSGVGAITVIDEGAVVNSLGPR